MSAADTAAVKALIETVTSLVGHVFVTTAPSVQTLPYILIHPADGTDEASRFTGPPTTENPEFTLHIVSGSATSVQTVTGLVKAKFKPSGLFVVPPTVAGRSNSRGYWRSPVHIQTDDSVTTPLLYQVIQLGWVSDPA